MAKLNVKINSVDKNLYDGLADIVVMKTVDGELAVMANHISMATILKAPVKIKNDEQEIFIDIKNAIAKVSDNTLSIINFN